MPAPIISKQVKVELLNLLRQRYRAAAKPDKGKRGQRERRSS